MKTGREKSGWTYGILLFWGLFIEARLDKAVSWGCDGVEPDNVDTYTNDSGFSLKASDQLGFNRWLAQQAHAHGLSVGLKNDIDQVTSLVNDFDWALNEQCFQYDACETLVPFVDAGKAVFGVEYELPTSQFCSKANKMNFDRIKKNYDLDAARQSCRRVRKACVACLRLDTQQPSFV